MSRTVEVVDTAFATAKTEGVKKLDNAKEQLIEEIDRSGVVKTVIDQDDENEYWVFGSKTNTKQQIVVQKRALKDSEVLLGGFLAGSLIEFCLTVLKYPLDTIKVRVQSKAFKSLKNDDVEQEQINEAHLKLQKMFATADVNHNGELSLEEALKAFGIDDRRASVHADDSGQMAENAIEEELRRLWRKYGHRDSEVGGGDAVMATELSIRAAGGSKGVLTLDTEGGSEKGLTSVAIAGNMEPGKLEEDKSKLSFAEFEALVTEMMTLEEINQQLQPSLREKLEDVFKPGDDNDKQKDAVGLFDRLTDGIGFALISSVPQGAVFWAIKDVVRRNLLAFLGVTKGLGAVITTSGAMAFMLQSPLHDPLLQIQSVSTHPPTWAVDLALDPKSLSTIFSVACAEAVYWMVRTPTEFFKVRAQVQVIEETKLAREEQARKKKKRSEMERFYLDSDVDASAGSLKPSVNIMEIDEDLAQVQTASLQAFTTETDNTDTVATTKDTQNMYDTEQSAPNASKGVELRPTATATGENSPGEEQGTGGLFSFWGKKRVFGESLRDNVAETTKTRKRLQRFLLLRQTKMKSSGHLGQTNLKFSQYRLERRQSIRRRKRERALRENRAETDSDEEESMDFAASLAGIQPDFFSSIKLLLPRALGFRSLFEYYPLLCQADIVQVASRQWMFLALHNSGFWDTNPGGELGLLYCYLTGAVFAAALTTPVDVARTRLLLQGSGSADTKYSSLIDCMDTIRREEGWLTLMSGLNVRLAYNGLVIGFLIGLQRQYYPALRGFAVEDILRVLEGKRTLDDVLRDYEAKFNISLNFLRPLEHSQNSLKDSFKNLNIFSTNGNMPIAGSGPGANSQDLASIWADVTSLKYKPLGFLQQNTQTYVNQPLTHLSETIRVASERLGFAHEANHANMHAVLASSTDGVVVDHAHNIVSTLQHVLPHLTHM